MRVDPKIGRFLLESITRGLYGDPLCILREYVQNSVDSIDRLVASGEMERGVGTIWITIDPTPSKRSITITDNGIGLTVDEAKRELSNIGESQKKGPEQRGFRGIGRLGGVAYCEKLIFRTKSRGSNEEIENTWDCAKIKKMLNPNNHEYSELNLADVVKECSSFEIKTTTRKAEESFFQVEMINVQCTKDRLLDIVTVRDYLSTVAPVPFDYLKFPYGNEIHDKLMHEVDNYGTYKIFVNNEEILKPYTVSLLYIKTIQENAIS
jgi:molecular chaperone HtpG